MRVMFRFGVLCLLTLAAGVGGCANDGAGEGEGEGEAACVPQQADFNYLTYLDLESNRFFVLGPPFFDEEHVDASWDAVATRAAIRFHDGVAFGSATGVAAVCDLTQATAEAVTRRPGAAETAYDSDSVFIVSTVDGGVFAMANMQAHDQNLTFDFVDVSTLPP